MPRFNSYEQPKNGGNRGSNFVDIGLNRKNSSVLGGGRQSRAKDITIGRKMEITVFEKSVSLDHAILTQFAGILGNQALKKEDELEFFDELNLFDQEWKFPYNRDHFDFHRQIQAQQPGAMNPQDFQSVNNQNLNMTSPPTCPQEFENNTSQVELFKRALVEAELQLRLLADAFEAVNYERLFFRAHLTSILSQKLESGIRQINAFEDLTRDVFGADLNALREQLSQAKADLKTSQSGFVRLKQRNMVLEDENVRLKGSLAEKREQLKKMRFSRGASKSDHHDTTKNTSNSNTHNQSNENSYFSKEFRNKFKSNCQVGPRLREENGQSGSAVGQGRWGLFWLLNCFLVLDGFMNIRVW